MDATRQHGPVSVDFAVPTAVTLSGIQASPAAAGPGVPLAGTLLALLAPLAGALALRRRRAQTRWIRGLSIHRILVRSLLQHPVDVRREKGGSLCSRR